MNVRILALLLTCGTSIHLKRPGSKLFSDVLFHDVGPKEADVGPSSKNEIVARREAEDGNLTVAIDEEIRLGFPLAKQSPQPLWKLVSEAKEGGITDPCKADLLMNGLNYPFGLGCRAMMLVDELQVAAYLNKTVAICDGNSHQEGIGWSHFFANRGFGVCSNPQKCSARSTAAAWLGSRMSKALRKESDDNVKFLTHMKRLLYGQLFSFNDKTNRNVAGTLQRAGLEQGIRYVGVHIRRGDKTVSRDIPMSVYSQAIAAQLAWRGTETVFVASDDPHAGDELASELKGLSSISTDMAPAGVRVIQLYSPDSSSRTYDSDAGMVALLTDVAALRDAEVFIGTHTSYIGRFVYFLRGPESESMSLSGDWLRGIML